MMRVTIEIAPNGDEARVRHVDTLYIGNMSSLQDISDYAVWANVDPRQFTHEDRPVADLWVENHARAAGYGPLLQRIMGHFGQGL